jgi:hypothetical protein
MQVQVDELGHGLFNFTGIVGIVAGKRAVEEMKFFTACGRWV